MIPKPITALNRFGKMTGSIFAEKIRVDKNTIGSRVYNANKSKYCKKTGEKIISTGNGYTLLSKAEKLDLLESVEYSLRSSLRRLYNTKDVAYMAQIEAREDMLKITTTYVPQIAKAIDETTKLPNKDEQIKLLENKIRQIKET